LPTEQEQTTFPLGGDFVDEHFFNRQRAAHPQAQLTRNKVRETM
jgi:hypothetical protein